MSRRAAAFRHSDVVKAVKAAKAAGNEIAGITFPLDGGFSLRFGKPLEAQESAPDSSADRMIEELKAAAHGKNRHAH
jgi:hypothetical protein